MNISTVTDRYASQLTAGDLHSSARTCLYPIQCQAPKHSGRLVAWQVVAVRREVGPEQLTVMYVWDSTDQHPFPLAMCARPAGPLVHEKDPVKT